MFFYQRNDHSPVHMIELLIRTSYRPICRFYPAKVQTNLKLFKAKKEVLTPLKPEVIHKYNYFHINNILWALKKEDSLIYRHFSTHDERRLETPCWIVAKSTDLIGRGMGMKLFWAYIFLVKRWHSSWRALGNLHTHS